jgi:hypothetical protein
LNDLGALAPNLSPPVSKLQKTTTVPISLLVCLQPASSNFQHTNATIFIPTTTHTHTHTHTQKKASYVATVNWQADQEECVLSDFHSLTPKQHSKHNAIGAVYASVHTD